jgi:Rod binding domain-containing protein
MSDLSSISAPQIPMLSQGLAAPLKKDTPEKIETAAKQFEALLIGQLMKSMHESGSKGWLGEQDESSESAMEMAEEQFAQALANGGGLGLARMVVQGLSRSAEGEQPGDRDKVAPIRTAPITKR